MKNFLFALVVAAFALGCHAGSDRSNTSANDIPRLIQDLKEGDENCRAEAAEALGDLGADGKAALPALVSALGDEGERVRQNVLRAIIAIGPDAKATPALTNSLKDSDSLVRALSANALGQLGPLARQSVPALREALHDRDETVKKEAADALRAIVGPEKR
jgi:HEAT repeat protein